MYEKSKASDFILRALAVGALTFPCLACAHAETDGLDDGPSADERGGSGGTPSMPGAAGTSYGGYGYGGNASGSAGVAGAGGSSASGGSSTSGGSGGQQGGSSGSAGSAGSGSAGTPPVSVDGFSVQYKVEQMTNTIGCQLTIKNSGSLTVPLAELTLRYYFTNEVSVSTVTDINWAGVNPGSKDFKGQVTAQVADLMPAASAADSYLEFSFSGSALSVAPGETADLSWQIHAGDWSQPYVQTGDYSFDMSKTNLADWDHVVLLRNGAVAWGAEP